MKVAPAVVHVLPVSQVQPAHDLVSAGLLAAIAGGVDAAGWICLAGLLPSHLTASLVMLGTRVSEHDAADVGARVAMIPVFVLTVGCVKWLARALESRALPVLQVLLSVMTFGMALFGLAGALSDAILSDDPRVLLGIGGLGVASMAVQNAIMRLCLVRLCPTTVMTGNLTQSVMAGVDLLLGRGDADARTRLTNAGAPLLGFLLGSVSCGWIAAHYGLLCLSLPFVLSAAITARAWAQLRSDKPAARSARPQPLLFPVGLIRPRSA